MGHLIGYLIGIVVAWPLAANLQYRYFQRKWPNLAKEDYEEDIAVSVLLGLLISVLWPIFVPASLVGAVIVRLNKKPL